MSGDDGIFGWGDPSYGRPRVTILQRGPDPKDPKRQRALVEVEIGVDPALRLRFSLPVARLDTAEIIRMVALRTAIRHIPEAHEHLEGLADTVDAQDLDAHRVFAGDVLKLPREFGGQD